MCTECLELHDTRVLISKPEVHSWSYTSEHSGNVHVAKPHAVTAIEVTTELSRNEMETTSTCFPQGGKRNKN